MLIYSKTKVEFMDDMDDDVLVKELEDTIRKRMHRKTGPGEIRSWENSLKEMYMVLNSSDIPDDCGVAIEYNVPLTNKRVDFIVSGIDDQDVEHAQIIELKQWDHAEVVSGQDAIVRTYVGHGNREVAHPSYQAWSYAQLISDYNTSVQDGGIVLHPCAFAHNYRIDGTSALVAPDYQEYLDRAPLFGWGERRKLRADISSHIPHGDHGATIEHIDHGRLRPSKSLQDSLASMLSGNDEFTLIDSQKVFFEKAVALSKEAARDEKKIVYVVEGGPGTGKSVIAVNLLARLTQMNQVVAYVSKNSAPRNVYATELKGTRSKKSIDALFKGSGTFTETDSNVYDTLIVDEAHRLNEKSGIYSNLGENQVKEIVNAARCSIFFIDESQQVTVSDIGSVDEIKRWAEFYGAEVYTDVLDSQFRCNGSDGYLAWLDDTLEIRTTANWNLEGIDYNFKVFDNPADMEQAIREKNDERGKARLVAGYCWAWPTATKSNTNFHDIQIGDWSISWNLGNTSTYAIDDSSINECGCIHTVQGLEFDYIGVIIGPDMRYMGGKIVTDFAAHPGSDKAMLGLRGRYRTDPEGTRKLADKLIKNTYRTLMTRGMKGCYVYCCDKALSSYLRSRITNWLAVSDDEGSVSFERLG